jgi:hypothetical protein
MLQSKYGLTFIYKAKKIRLGVAGCGYWGPNLIRNFRAFARLPSQDDVRSRPDAARTPPENLPMPPVSHKRALPHWLNALVQTDGITVIAFQFTENEGGEDRQ